MNRPDVIVTQPTSVDFPFFRYNLERFKKYFNHVYIALANSNGRDNYANFFKYEAFPNVTVLDPILSPGDWRHNAVTNALLVSNVAADVSSTVLFLEQDFLIKDERIFEIIEAITMDYNTVLYNDGGRIHPAFAFVERNLLAQTNMDFGANPPAYDHFGHFFQDLLRVSNAVELEDLGIVSGEDYYHMAGLTNNYQRFDEGQSLYKSNEFLTYNHFNIILPVKQEPSFLAKMQAVEERNSFEESESDPIIESFFITKGGQS